MRVCVVHVMWRISSSAKKHRVRQLLLHSFSTNTTTTNKHKQPRHSFLGLAIYGCHCETCHRSDWVSQQKYVFVMDTQSMVENTQADTHTHTRARTRMHARTHTYRLTCTQRPTHTHTDTHRLSHTHIHNVRCVNKVGLQLWKLIMVVS